MAQPIHLNTNQSCCESPQPPIACCPDPEQTEPFPIVTDDEPCCGPPPAPPSGPFEKPGYRIWHFTTDFIETPAGAVPQIRTRLQAADRVGTVLARLGVTRNNYTTAPGLYAVGKPNETSPVLVTANYKLTFDTLRKELIDKHLWLLVLETRGINVWCAAGKGTFGSREVIRSVRKTRLDTVVNHRKLVLPQLGAVGVSARAVKKECGFEVIWGPIRARDVRRFLESGMKADGSMHRVTFTTTERLVLIPVEVSALPRPTMWFLIAAFLLSGIGPDIFSFGNAWFRGWMVMAAYLTGILSGAIAVPAGLPWIPGRAFSIKGVITGCAFGTLLLIGLASRLTGLEALALLLCVLAVSSYLAMNFTGSTPFTSPSGVEREMRKAIPLQAAGMLAAAVLWTVSAWYV